MVMQTDLLSLFMPLVDVEEIEYEGTQPDQYMEICCVGNFVFKRGKVYWR